MRKRRVLLVDDEIMIREGFKRLFDWNKHDCEVVGDASDGVSAINQVDICKPDIVIIDINIPIINGLEVIRILRQKYPKIAFIIVSGYDDFYYCQKALRLKIVDYILKPVDFNEFGTVIDNVKIELYEEDMRQKEHQDGREEEKLIFAMTKYIQENLAEDISEKKLSEVFHLNANYISQLFKNEIGVNYLTYLTNARIEKASTLLITTDKPVTEIASLVGIKDYRIFSKLFKKIENMPPSQFRKLRQRTIS